MNDSPQDESALFSTMPVPPDRTVCAPDGSDVRILLGLAGGGMAHFELPAGQVSRAVMHRTVDEIWFVLAGQGEMWRKQGTREQIVPLVPGICLTIPLGTRFQFRALAGQSVTAIGITMPPWPGDGEANLVEGPWQPTVPKADQ